jgi:hypothetical protein
MKPTFTEICHLRLAATDRPLCGSDEERRHGKGKAGTLSDAPPSRCTICDLPTCPECRAEWNRTRERLTRLWEVLERREAA